MYNIDYESQKKNQETSYQRGIEYQKSQFNNYTVIFPLLKKTKYTLKLISFKIKSIYYSNSFAK